MARVAVAALALALVGPVVARSDPVTEGAREQSCKALAASTVGLPD
jgi:hypothetical protein